MKEEPNEELHLGDRVRYSLRWLLSTGTYSDKMAQAEGTVTGLVVLGGIKVAQIAWATEDMPIEVIANRLEVMRRKS